MPSGGDDFLEVRSAGSDQDTSMLDILEAALHRRRCRYSSADLATVLSACGMTPANVQHFLRELSSKQTLNHSMSGLSSLSAQQFAVFKSLWLQATRTNQLGYTETGLTLHEVYLLQHLQDGDHNPFAPSLTCPTIRTLATTTSNNSAASRAVTDKADSQAGRVDSHQLAEWALFAEPPDCPVPSSLVWAATLCSNSSDGGSKPRTDCCSTMQSSQA
jgi:hypothetical protein